MDPWVSKEIAEVEGSSFNGNLGTLDSLHDITTTSCPEGRGNTTQTFFEDNFQPQPVLDSQQIQQPFAKLPDSQEYLESLEKKLSVIQKGGKKGATASSILESLNQVKESCMVKLLSNSINEENTQEDFTSDDIKFNIILQKIAPAKQAISAEELVHLLKADQLDILNSESSATAAIQLDKSEEKDSIENSFVAENKPDL